ncbi:polysaccharide deacetylase family protein [Anaerophilus nitritogenes]|uniref:polysaccharide deacetylase family protein n=1 Tax=Anaerophilus nitritogenes TaxID=2498136 RepID=UPI00101DAB59|nr:polysaccharide deacetylase family protein [Anaerophilus nitritogenes]
MKKIKWYIVLIIALFPIECFGIDKDIDSMVYIVVNDQLVSFEETYPVIKEGMTYVPIRFLADHLKVKIKWDKKSNSIFLTKGSKQIILDITLNALFTNQGQIITDGIFLEDGRTMVPYKFIAKYFGYEVSYIDKGPIARATNQSLCVEDEDLFDILQNKIIQEKEKILIQIQRKKEEQIARERIEMRKNLKVVYITFDDGPTPYTKEILDILNQYDSKATFFMLSDRIRNYKSVVREIIAQGNSVGLHGVSHNVNKIYKSEHTVVGEMNQCNEELQKVVGIRTNLIRVPYGSIPHMKKNYVEAVNTAGYKMWDWNVDSEDSSQKNISPNQILSNVKKQVKNKNVAVILLHERKATVKALPELLKYLKAEGYITIPIDYREEPINFWNQKK